MRVYAICDGRAVKFGITRNSAHSRMSELQIGNSVNLGLAADHPCKNPRQLEEALHQMLAPWRLRGEWFEHSEPVYRAVEWLRKPEGSLRDAIYRA